MTQETALKILQTGANVFLTGEPGSGKTHMINQYVAWLRARGIEPAITASTGIAATHIGGLTIHSWSGVGIRRGLSEYDLDIIATNERVAKRIRRARILIIDEVSMLSDFTFDMVDAVCREVRQKNEPFGGLQVVLVGDFFQLPPVGPAPFAFRSRAWRTLNPLVCYLSEQYRQEDTAFLGLLSAVRSGTVDGRVHGLLASRRADEVRVPRDLPRLYSHNIDVDRINEERLAVISGTVRQFMMTSRGPGALTATLKRGCLSPEILSLKVGARVIFTKNNPNGSFTNGTLGEVEKFTGDGMPIVRTIRGRRIYVEPMEWTIADGARVLARISQVPLRLAWAITVHKSQGMTLDAALCDLSQAFEYGQGYVALSRVRSLAGLHIVGWNDRALEVHPEISAQDQDFKLRSTATENAFASMPTAEHGALMRNFVVACGGRFKGAVSASSGKSKSRGTTQEATLVLLKEGKTVREIAKARALAETTIISHIIDLHVAGRIDRADVESLVSPALRRAFPKIHAAFRTVGGVRLKPVFEKLRGVYSYDDLRLALLLLGDQH